MWEYLNYYNFSKIMTNKNITKLNWIIHLFIQHIHRVSTCQVNFEVLEIPK